MFTKKTLINEQVPLLKKALLGGTDLIDDIYKLFGSADDILAKEYAEKAVKAGGKVQNLTDDFIDELFKFSDLSSVVDLLKIRGVFGNSIIEMEEKILNAISSHINKNSQISADKINDLVKVYSNRIDNISYIKSNPDIKNELVNNFKLELYKEFESKIVKNVEKPKTFKFWSEMSQQEIESLLKRLEGAENIEGWRYFGNSNFLPASGWKYHVYAEDLYDSVFLYEKLKPVVDKWGARAKVGGDNIQVFNNVSSPQWGKQGATIYIPPDVIAKGKQAEFLSDIQTAISGYSKKGTIQGENMITDNIGYRYDFNNPIDSKIGSDYNSAGGYRKNVAGMKYKPDNVEDLFDIKPSSESDEIIYLTRLNQFSGNRISNRSFTANDIDWTNIKNKGVEQGNKTIQEYYDYYMQLIAEAIQTGDYQYISSKGFEKFGIDNFREFLQYNIKKVHEVIPDIGRWSVDFK